MKRLTVEEFYELPDDERRERYKELSDHDRFRWRTEYENPIEGCEHCSEPADTEPPTAAEEERRRKAIEKWRNVLRERGILKD